MLANAITLCDGCRLNFVTVTGQILMVVHTVSPLRLVDGFYDRSDVDVSVGEHVGAQAATVNQSAQNSVGGESFQMRAGLTQTPANALHLTDSEPPPHQRIEVDATGDQIAPRLRIAEPTVPGQLQGVEDLGFDESEVIAATRCAVAGRERPGLRRVAVPSSPCRATARASSVSRMGPVARSASAIASTCPRSRGLGAAGAVNTGSSEASA